MDTYLIAVRLLERYFKTNGNTLKKNYKEAISEQGKEMAEFNKEKKHRKKAREYYRRFPLKKRGEKCKKEKTCR